MPGQDDSEQEPKKAVRIEEVARHAGVSPATVSRVLNGRGKCSPENRERVLKAIRDLGYLPSAASRALAKGREVKTLGLLLPNIGTVFMSTLTRAVVEAACGAGYDVLLAVRPEGTGQRLLGRNNTAGVLAFASQLTHPDVELLIAERCPTVLMYQRAKNGSSVPCVIIENAPAAQRIVGHLIEVHGRRRVAFLKGPNGNEDSLLRESGYRDALLAHGIELDPRLLRTGVNAREAYAATMDLFSAGLAPDGIFAWSDDAAAGAVNALRSLAKSVPRDVSVVGFDDAPIASVLDPPLTTVRAPTERVAQRAVEQLVRLIEHGTTNDEVCLATELVVRRSCGCPA